MRYRSLVKLFLLIVFIPASASFLDNLIRWLYLRRLRNVHVQFPSICGQLLNERIVGGDEAPPYAWPWAVSLQNILGQHICGGVLITSRHVLTAAHCVYNRVYFPWFTKVSVGSEKLGGGDIFDIDVIILHPKFDKSFIYPFDLAVVVLSSEVSDKTSKVCLPSLYLSATYPFPSNYGVAVGWGRTSDNAKYAVKNLRQVEVKILSTENCKGYRHLYSESIMICAGWEGGGKDTCQGDSGGPLLWLNSEGNWEVHGIVSFGFGCANKGFPGVYTKVIEFNDWIREIVLNGRFIRY
ncbi:Proclotting enzyme [Armadillidium nasatum]|uniref:limulus clotting factor C n=1 Tax=Armadillidium nasatum TaxID=96803 RepID=A0A5N5SL45_9CRUS|nr:Proclotting enzyme [Armadillidium nasatum]